MPFYYRLQKMLDFRIRKKDEQLQVVLKAQNEVYRIEGLIGANNKEISQTKINMRKADFMLLEAYDNYIKHLYEIDERLQEDKKLAEEILRQEKEKLIVLEQAVKVLEKHKEHAKDDYIEEEKKQELKQYSEIGIQKFFIKSQEKKEEELIEELKRIEGEFNAH